ncbi:ABC transporter permease [Paenibacillus xanthanilyticus]|uniref:ABC transporter permease n=1 Tax=Paenibacillus xanthanilyticus TaxID=1783531 RepID=A0ABV8K383_9BACL
MLARILSAEFLKIRGKMLWFLAVLGPLGVAGLQGVNYGLRYDYLMNVYKDDLWGGLISNVSAITLPTLFIGLAILASMAAGIEHQTNAWKQTLALPVPKTAVFAAKALLNVLLLFVSSTLLFIMTIALGAALGFDLGDLPYGELLQTLYYPYVAALPFMVLQVWLSVTLANQAVPLTVGIVGMIVAMFGSRFDDWVPYKWPHLLNGAGEPLYSVLAGAALGVVLLFAGMAQFARKDVS